VSDLDAFVRLSAALTGFERVDLLGTGQAPHYFDWVTTRADLATLRKLWDLARGPLTDRVLEKLLADAALGPVAKQINFLWYTGQWKDPFPPEPGTQTTIVSAAAYREGLVWRAAAAHPSGAKQTGFASWATLPGGKESP
jgi:hypothetical protein